MDLMFFTIVLKHVPDPAAMLWTAVKQEATILCASVLSTASIYVVLLMWPHVSEARAKSRYKASALVSNQGYPWVQQGLLIIPGFSRLLYHLPSIITEEQGC